MLSPYYISVILHVYLLSKPVCFGSLQQLDPFQVKLRQALRRRDGACSGGVKGMILAKKKLDTST